MKKFIISVMAVLSMGLCLNAQNPLPNDPAVRVGKLENGMTYYIRANKKPAGRAEFYLSTHAGALYEEIPSQDGLAHFLEHMCFNGTKNFPGKEILNQLQTIGAEFGRNINAATGFEQTNYMLNNIPVNKPGALELSLMVLHDYSHFVLCEPEEIDAERGVIIEEKRTRNTASWRNTLKSLPVIFGPENVFATHTLIGGQEQLETFKPEELVKFYQKWYIPDNQAVIVVGDVNVDEVEGMIQRIFSDIPKVENPAPRPLIKADPCKTPRVGIVTDPENSSSSVEIYFMSDALNELNGTDIGFLIDYVKMCASIVMSERLKEISSQLNAPFLNASAGVGGVSENTEAFVGNVTFKDGEGLKAFKALMAEIEKLQRYGFTDDEIDRANRNILSFFEMMVQGASTRDNADYVNELIQHFFTGESYTTPQTDLQMAQTLSPQINAMMVNNVLSRFFTGENIAIVYSAPEKEGLSHPTEEQLLNVLAEVKTMEIQANSGAKISDDLLSGAKLKGSKVAKTDKKGPYGSTVWTLKNGVNVYVLPTDYAKDEVHIYTVEKGGESLIATEDLASFESNVWALTRQQAGLSTFDAPTLQKMLSGKNVSNNVYIDDLYHGDSCVSTPKDIETAFQLIYLSYVAPRFDETPFQRGIEQGKALLPNLATNPQFEFQNQMYKTLYGNNARKPMVSMQLLDQASLEAQERVYKELFKSFAGGSVVIVGNVNLKTLKPLVEKYIGSIPVDGEPSEWVDPNIDPVKGVVTNNFEFPMQAPKSTVCQFFTGDLEYNVKNIVALEAASFILDQVYVETIREREGGTYGASSSLSLDRVPKQEATFFVYFDTNVEMAEKLAGITKEELVRLGAEGPDDVKFAQAIENLKKNIPEKKVKNSYWKNLLVRYINQGVSTWDADYEAAVNSLTKEDIKSVITKVMSQGNAVEIKMFGVQAQ